MNNELLTILERTLTPTRKSAAEAIAEAEAPKRPDREDLRLLDHRREKAGGPYVIVVDNDVISYFCLEAGRTGAARMARERDPD